MYCQNCGAFLGQETADEVNGQSAPGQGYEASSQYVPGQGYDENDLYATGQDYDSNDRRISGRDDNNRWQKRRYPEKERKSGDGAIKFLIGLTALFAVTAVAFAVCRVVTGKYPLELFDKSDETTMKAEAETEASESDTEAVSSPDTQNGTTTVSSSDSKASVASVTERTDSTASVVSADTSASGAKINQTGNVSYTGLAGDVTPAAQSGQSGQTAPAAQNAGGAAAAAGGAAQNAGGAAAAAGGAAQNAGGAAAAAGGAAQNAGGAAAAGTESMNIEDIDAAAGQTTAPAADDAPTEMRLISATDANLAGQSLIGITAAAASSTISQSGTANDPILVFDRRDETSWQEGVSGYGLGEWLKASFDGNYKVKYMAFKLGNWKNDKYYYGNAKPKTLEILIGDFRGEITFPDERAVQWVEFSKEVDANAMEITIRDVYAGTSWQDTCIAAIDVYGSYVGMP